LIFFAVQLATLLKAGIALLRALEIIRRGTANAYFQKIIKELGQDVSGGAPLSAGLEKHRKVFPWVWINLVKVGEATGKLPEVLEEVAHYQEASERIKSKVISAFFYPGILTVAVIAALTFLLIFIVPKFAEIFQSQNMPLPAITQVVIAASNALRFHFPYVVAFVVILVLGVRFLKRTPAGRISYDHFRLNLPIFGDLLVQVGVVRFSRSLATLLKAGVQILQGLEISGKLVENRFIEDKLKDVALAVRSGQGLGVQLEYKKIFPVFMTQLVSVGEESGQLERFLDLIANFYEDRVDTFLTRLAMLLEPILLLFMGGVIGTIVVSMFLPIIELSTGGAVGM
jgi:type IV pilus assembly protein PilC